MTTTSDAINAYVASAVEHGKATEDGDSTRANAAHDRLMEALGVLTGGNEREKLLGLLDHADPSVRCWAATHSLPLDEEGAKGVLQEISEGAGLVAFDAAMVLSEWDKGTLSVP